MEIYTYTNKVTRVLKKSYPYSKKHVGVEDGEFVHNHSVDPRLS